MHYANTKKLALRIMYLSLLCLFLYSNEVFAFDDGDFQYWHNTAFSWKIKDNYKFSLEEESRFGDDAKDFYYQHYDIGVTYSGICKWLELSANYRQVFQEKDNEWLKENIPHLNASVKWELFGTNFSNRARFEYKNREDLEDYWRYRNKFTVKPPLKFTRFKIQPYIADEVFYDFNVERVNTNRFYCGINADLSKMIKLELYYLWVSSEKNHDWDDTNVLGTNLKIAF